MENEIKTDNLTNLSILENKFNEIKSELKANSDLEINSFKEAIKNYIDNKFVVKKTQLEKDQVLIRLLKIDRLSYLLADTSKGKLEKNLRKDSNTYYYSLDSVPLNEEDTKSLLSILEG